MSENANMSQDVVAVAEGDFQGADSKHPMLGIQKQVKKYDAEAVTRFLEGDFENFEIDDDSFSKMFDNAIKTIKEDELVNGKIVNITKDEVFVDVGFKSLGVVPKAELLNAETYKVGDEIDVFIEKMEDSNGKLLLSRRRADL